jgi:hypothetical protein
MTMVLGPTKNAGVKRDAETEDTLRGEKEVQGDRDWEADAQVGEPEPQPGAQVAEAKEVVQ